MKPGAQSLLMNYTPAEWLNLVVRWTHVFASILWVGQTYFFTWLDGRFSEEEREGSGGSAPPTVWMVHSGGFYAIEKRKLGRQVPPKLRWFKWEAAITWLSGFVLLILVYYMGGLMVDASVTTSAGLAVGIGVGVMIVGWAVYDGVWKSPLGRSERTATIVLYGLVVLVAYGLCRIMSGRAAYLHVGGMFGTIMAANVWMRILPAQRRMIRAVAEGRTPDERLAAQAKLRSKHNTFIVVPVVLIMLSNHFPVATYGNRYNWLILSVLILAGWGAAKHMRRA